MNLVLLMLLFLLVSHFLPMLNLSSGVKLSGWSSGGMPPTKGQRFGLHRTQFTSWTWENSILRSIRMKWPPHANISARMVRLALLGLGLWSPRSSFEFAMVNFECFPQNAFTTWVKTFFWVSIDSCGAVQKSTSIAMLGQGVSSTILLQDLVYEEVVAEVQACRTRSCWAGFVERGGCCVVKYFETTRKIPQVMSRYHKTKTSTIPPFPFPLAT